uniref:Uncharacterized protein n=1 Tax=Castor canadensis TaxID=51338 RepID=A0A8C0W9T9_CASCN
MISFSLLPFRGISLPQSAMEQTILKTRTALKAASQQLSPAAQILGKLDKHTCRTRVLRADGSCEKRWSHGCTLSIRRPSHNPRALPSLSLIFILGQVVIS